MKFDSNWYFYLFKVKSLISKFLYFIPKLFSGTKKNIFPQSFIITTSTYSPWLRDEEFKKTLSIVQKNTLIDEIRLYGIWQLLDQIKGVKGEIFEIGSWRGGSGALIAKKLILNDDKTTVNLFDTFEGVVKTDLKYDNKHKGGEYKNTSIDLVKKFLEKNNIFNTKLHKGVFPDDFIDKDIIAQKLKFVHIDVDAYFSTKEIFKIIWPNLVKNGIVLFDDYGLPGCEGVTSFVNENINRNDLLFVYNISGHAIFIKK